MARSFANKPAPVWAMRLVKHRGLVAPVGAILLLGVIVVPLPPAMMDVLIAMNLSLAIIMLMTTVYLDDALDFSVFPSLLLGATLLRLVLNVATTRLILTADANSPQEAVGVAGKVISAFGSFVAGDSLVVGIIIFTILVVIQFVVITKGATRISEVAARFTLDAMPGKQMAIDADLNAGLISEEEARVQRQRIREEADFFGAMDGASKFVRGDAIAGIIITIVNIVGGFTVGALEKGWSIGESAQVFTRLTIGDGLVSQLPAFVIALASGLVVTRAGAKESLGDEMTSQLAGRPLVLGLTAGFLGVLAFTPLPALPLLGIAAFLGITAFLMMSNTRSVEDEKKKATAAKQTGAHEPPPVDSLLKLDTMELEVGYGLVALVDANQGGDLLERISSVRRQLAADLGFVMPPVRIRDNMSLEPSAYRVKIRGAVIAESSAEPGKLLAMDSGLASGQIQGKPTREPAFGLDAWWIDPGQKSRAEAMNYTVVDPTTVLTTHIAEIVKAHADELLSREEVNNLIEGLKERAPRLVEEAIPGVVKPGELQKVLQNLLRERCPIRDLETIVETLADWAPRTKDVDVLTEYVRNAIRRSICQRHAVHADPEPGKPASVARLRLVAVTLDPAFEDFINGHIDRSSGAAALSMPAATANRIARRVADALKPVIAAGHNPVVIASPQVRAVVRQIIEPHLPGAAVLGYNEIISDVEVESMGLVTLQDDPPAARDNAAGQRRAAPAA